MRDLCRLGCITILWCSWNLKIKRIILYKILFYTKILLNKSSWESMYIGQPPVKPDHLRWLPFVPYLVFSLFLLLHWKESFPNNWTMPWCSDLGGRSQPSLRKQQECKALATHMGHVVHGVHSVVLPDFLYAFNCSQWNTSGGRGEHGLLTV